NGISNTGDIGTTGNMFVGEDLSVVGQSFLSDTSVNGELGVTGNATVLGNTNLGGTLNVEGATTLQSTLLVEGATTINNTLLVSTGDTTFDVNGTSANLTVDDGTNASSLAVTSTTVSLTNSGSGMTSSSGATTVTGTTQATITGGTTSMLVSNSGVNFSGAGGAPVRLSGVADGVAPFDAVNVRQLEQMDRRLSAGIAGTMAMTQLPTISAGESSSFGIAFGHYNSQSALAMGGAVRVTDSMTVRGALQHSSVGGTGGAVGLGWSW
ncbi:YadA-like family protein, partial [Falsigemmobacter intermedius]